VDNITKTQLTMLIEKNEAQIIKKIEEAIRKILQGAYYKDVHFVSFKKVK
tara:strand:- start:3031 stop:3180 length:150 start_codon:yes stop_codon:yes gene_type:complete